MGTYKSVEEARTYFVKDRFATDNGITLDDLSDEKSVCSVNDWGWTSFFAIYAFEY